MSENSGSFGYFTFSVVVHTAMAAGILLLPQLELLDEGSGHMIEFVAMEAPQGEQLETIHVAEKEVPSPVQEEVAPLPAPPQTEPVVAKPAPKPEAKKVEVTKVTPPKKEEPEDKFDEFLAEQNEEDDLPAIESEPETLNIRAVAMTDISDLPDEEEIKKEVEEQQQDAALTAALDAPASEEPMSIKEEVKQEKPTVAPVIAAAPVKEAPKAPPVPTKPIAAAANTKGLKESESLSKSAQAQPSTQPQNQAAKAYGKPSGKIRSYLDLTQVAGNQPPRYPTVARRMKQQGAVHLAYYVQSNGAISNLKIVKSSGYPKLDNEAIRAVSKYRYKPGQAGWTLHPVNFQLQGPYKKMPSRLRTSQRNANTTGS